MGCGAPHPTWFTFCLRDAESSEIALLSFHTVFITIMQGEFNHQLKWPFQGEFNVSLLNQKEYNGHQTRTIHFDDTVPDDVTNRKKERDPVTVSGRDGEYQNSFIIITYNQNNIILKMIALIRICIINIRL